MIRGVSVARLLVAIFGVAIVGVIALWVRLLAVNALPVDFDEDDYLRAGQLYATGLQHGDPGVFLRENYRTEHPPLSKIVIGLAIEQQPPAPEIPDRPTTAPPATDLPENLLYAARTAEAEFGALTAVALAVLSPLGGFWLAVHTWTIKYTSQVMLESVPAFFALLAVLCYVSALRSRRRRTAWLLAAAIAFGLACDGKYLYGVAGIAIAVDWIWRTHAESARPSDRLAGLWQRIRAPLGWLLVSLAVFFIADPYLWPDPIGRLWSSISYHGGYATSDAVQQTGWPSWQPLVWLMGSVPFHAPGTFLVAVDLPITVLAAVGIRQLWARQRVFALWLFIAFAFLVVWPTKWPQYILVLSAPLSLSAGYGTRIVLEPVWRRLRAVRVALRSEPLREGAAPPSHSPSRDRSRGARIRRSAHDLRVAFPWLAPGMAAFIVLALVPIAYELLISLTDLRLSSLRDGMNGGVVRAAVGGLLGQVPASPVDLGTASKTVNYVGGDLLGAFQSGVWLGGQTSAEFPAFSLLWMVLAVGLQAALGIAVALVLERPGVRFAAAWRTLFILPWAIPELVGAIAFRDIFAPNVGLLALFLGRPLPWPDSPDLALVILLLASTWIGWPLWMLVATAGLRTIPRATAEAAALDGAGRWRSFRDVTLPLLLPLLAPAFVIRGIAAFNQFYLFYVLGPPDSTTTVATWSFQIFDSTRGPGLYAVSAALNIMTLVALAAVVIWFLRWRSRAERVAFA